MKEHIQAQMVNELKEIAIKYHNYGCLRELISGCFDKYIATDKKYADNSKSKNKEPVNQNSYFWTPVGKEYCLPPKTTPLFVTVVKTNGIDTWTAVEKSVLSATGKWLHESCQREVLGQVIAWMPIPEPYKEKV